MNKNYWFTADSHYGHANIIKYSGRPFESAEEHDAQLIENWNAHVSVNDDVFHLGDFAFKCKNNEALNYRQKLNGNIHFIIGNHDAAAHQIRQHFQWFKDVHQIDVNGQGIFLSHYAHRTWNKSHYGNWHLYGHSHFSLPDDPNSLSFDVGVDAVAARASGLSSGIAILKGQTKPEDYRPINFDEVKQIMATKKFKPVDHHGENPR